MSYNFVADSFHIKKLFNTLSSNKMRFQMENGSFAFLSSPLGGGLETKYDVHLGLIGNRVMDFLC